MARKKKEFNYAETFDRLMEEEFGEKFETSWNLLLGSFGEYQTVRSNGKKLTQKHVLYGRGLSNGIATRESV